jgi:hypothetical protein
VSFVLSGFTHLQELIKHQAENIGFVVIHIDQCSTEDMLNANVVTKTI